MSAVPQAIVPAVNGWNAEFLESTYRQYKADPDAVAPDLRSFFQGFDLAMASHPGGAGAGGGGGVGKDLADAMRVQHAAADLIDSYRRRGHFAAKIDPFDRERPRPANLTLEYHGLTPADLDKRISTGRLPMPETATLREVIDLLERTYCGSIGAHFMHASNDEERQWLANRCEQGRGRIELTRAEKAHVLERLVRAEQFEAFLGKRYPGEKRFSIEGGESLIPLLDRVIEAASNLGVEEAVIGMAHRGRLSVLNNILGKSYEQIFTEFEDSWEPGFANGGGDVKYHRGYSGQRTLPSGKTIHLALASNPSHLESVNGVVLGRTRGKQRLRNDTARERVMPVLLHGDAAVIGQGVVAETLNLSQLEGYNCGGAVHVVINNLIGFTTGPEDARTSRYCTDVALMIEAPVFHVNGEDPEAVVAAAQIAAEYRQKFHKDVFIDMYCYRKYGHNEQDEPSFTQPVLAAHIKNKPSVLKNYAHQLRDEGVISDADITAISDRLHDSLEKAQQQAKQKPQDPVIDPGSKRWQGFSGGEGGDGGYTFEPAKTAADEKLLAEVCKGLSTVPADFNVNPKLKKLLTERGDLLKTRQISYADAESLAFGTLLLEGHGVRLSGQDCRRGTFSHRHAVLRDFETGRPYTPLNNMRPIPANPDNAGKKNDEGKLTQGKFCVYDSPLSEFGVLGFDYGYSLADPNMLVMWEAQFGDFNNGAQIIIDQYIASAEIKWERWSGLVMLLPHGYEGAGPEHSSARLERFLCLCGNNNMQVVYPSTAAQCFHMLRRQVKASFRKPLIVMTPKSMLRINTSTIDEITAGSFQCMIDDPVFAGAGAKAKTGGVSRVVYCTGKIYHELAAKRETLKKNDVAIVRIEQLYPFHHELFKKIDARYPKDAERLWVQEEPRNAGAYLFIADMLRVEHGIELAYLGREMSATPAVGSKTAHKEQQEAILAAALGQTPFPEGGEVPQESDEASKNGSSPIASIGGRSAAASRIARSVRIPATSRRR